MRTTTRRTAIAAATIGLALAACGTDGADTGTDTGTDTEPTAAESSETTDAVDQATGATDEDAGPAVETSEVDIDDFRFKPGNVAVASGTTVTFTNQDATAHTVTAGDKDDPKPDEFDVRVEDQGETVEWTFDEPGTYAYYCVLHPFMEGTVTVS